MRRRIDPPSRLVEAEPAQDLEAQLPLLRRREAAGDPRRRGRPGRLDERNELLLQSVEDRSHLRGREVGLVVVEQCVVELLGRWEARDVAVPQLDHLLEPRAEALVVRLLPGLDPRAEGERAGACGDRRQLRRDADRLVEVAACHPHQAGLVGLGVETLLVRAQLLEQIADLVRDERLVREATDRRELLRANRRTVGRHDRLLIPGEQGTDLDEVVDLAELRAQGLECRRCSHSAVDRTRFDRINWSSSRRPSSPSRRTYITSRIKATSTSCVNPVSRLIVRIPRWTLRSSCSDAVSCTSVTSAAPATAPLTVFIPPTISITITANVGARKKVVGESRPTPEAYSEPPVPLR